MFLGFTQRLAGVSNCLILLNGILLYIYTTFVHLLIYKIWIAPTPLAVMNNAVRNIRLQVLCEHAFFIYFR